MYDSKTKRKTLGMLLELGRLSVLISAGIFSLAFDGMAVQPVIDPVNIDFPHKYMYCIILATQLKFCSLSVDCDSIIL